jgi:CBS domain-containing protein
MEKGAKLGSLRRLVMRARDVMVTPVVTVKPSSSVREAAKIFLERRISAVPVVDEEGKLVGIISEGDLLHRSESGTERRHSWWLEAFISDETLAAEYAKAHARKVADVMTHHVITAAPDTPLHEIATLLEKNSIKRVPIVQDGKLVGILSRANLVQAVASSRKALEIPVSDAAIRDQLLKQLKEHKWAHTSMLNVTVSGGVVDLWGIAQSDAERKAICVAAESIPGVIAVNDNLVKRPIEAGT